MNNRERWIVYPLLFYALVMGFKATYQDPVEFRCRSIECQQLKVGLINGSPAIGTSSLGNLILLDPSMSNAGRTPQTEADSTTDPAVDNAQLQASETNESTEPLTSDPSAVQID